MFIDSINSADHDADARLTADEKTLYFTSERGTVAPATRHRMWTASRVGAAFEFANLTLAFDYVNAALYDPTVSPDGLTLVVQHTTPAGTLLFTRDGKIARARRVGSTWTATLAPEAEAFANVRNPILSADGREICFSSDAGTPGKLRIHRAERASANAKFGPAAPVTELGGTQSYEAPTWLSADGCHLLLTSDRGGGLDVYVAVRGK